MFNEYEVSDKNVSTKNRWLRVIDFISMICLATFFLYFALKHMWEFWKAWRRARNLELRSQWRQQLLFSNSNISTNTTTTTNNNNNNNGGLEIGVIQALPMFRYSLSMKANDGEGTECAICLCEFMANESGRVLPRCKHRFHTECIDTWISSHSNCPLCRSSVLPFLLPNGPSSLQMVVL